MAGFSSEHEAAKAAAEIITAGVGSGTIKLFGNGGNPEAAAKSDGEYLVGLFKALIEGMKTSR